MLGSGYCLLKIPVFKNPTPEANGTHVKLQIAINKAIDYTFYLGVSLKVIKVQSTHIRHHGTGIFNYESLIIPP